MPGKDGFKWVYVGGHIDTVLDKIRNTGRPPKLNTTHLAKSWLVKDAKAGAVLDLLKDMGFLDDSGAPTESYSAFQNPAKSRSVLAAGIKKAYPKLFADYPNAQTLDVKTLEGYFKEHTGEDKSVVDKIKTTFAKLCSLAEFGAEDDSAPEVRSPASEGTMPAPGVKTSAPNLNQNLQLNFEIHIAADTPIDKIDAIFASMKKHLFENK